MFEAR